MKQLLGALALVAVCNLFTLGSVFGEDDPGKTYYYVMPCADVQGNCCPFCESSCSTGCPPQFFDVAVHSYFSLSPPIWLLYAIVNDTGSRKCPLPSWYEVEVSLEVRCYDDEDEPCGNSAHWSSDGGMQVVNGTVWSAKTFVLPDTEGQWKLGYAWLLATMAGEGHNPKIRKITSCFHKNCGPPNSCKLTSNVRTETLGVGDVYVDEE